MSICLLIVEDDQEAAGIIRGLVGLKLPGLSVRLAKNGREGVEVCKAFQPDIVVTDISMPDVDGIRMSREIKAFRPDTKLIVLTGYSDCKLEEFGDLEIHDYFVKPTDFRKLLLAIETCVAEVMVARGGT